MTKYICLLTLALVCCTCKPSKTNTPTYAQHWLPESNMPQSPVCQALQDSVYICNDRGLILKYPKSEFDDLAQKYNQFFSDAPQSPDFTYLHDDNKPQFDSPQGQDHYYMLYAYFLKQHNGKQKYAPQRQQLMAIYNQINQLFRCFDGGGLYFEHQNTRLSAYAEYGVALWRREKPRALPDDDFKKQKQVYLKGLGQLMIDHNNIDFNSPETDKKQRLKQLKQSLMGLDSLLNNRFYLASAQEFQYRHYEYLGQQHAKNHHDFHPNQSIN
jgi:hypothetical protein